MSRRPAPWSGLTNVLVWFGGSKDVSFNQEISDLVGRVRVPAVVVADGRRTRPQRPLGGDPDPAPEEIRQLPEKQALVIAENAQPIIAELHRCIEGRDGRRLLAQQRALRERLAACRATGRDVEPAPPTPSRRRSVMAGDGTPSRPALGDGVPGAGPQDPEGLPRPVGDPARHRGAQEEARQPGEPAAPVGPRHLPRPAAALGTLAVARPGRGVGQLRVRVGGLRRRLHPRLLAAAPAHRPRTRRPGRSATPAGHAPNSDVLENWHRYVLPGFLDRMRQRLKQSCDDDHQPWPARSRHTRHTGEAASASRLGAFEADLLALVRDEEARPAHRQFTLLDGGDLIDPDTGEVF